VPLFLDFLVAASFDEFTDLLGDLLAKFDEGTRIPSSASPRKNRQFFGAGAFGQFGGEKGERKRRRKFEGASFQLLCKEYH
jgi:hypothetical protein